MGFDDHLDLFPALKAQDVQERVSRMWDLSGALPLPKWDVACTCGAKRSDGAILLRRWHRHKRNTGGGNPWRIDVAMKCTVCSLAFVYGVSVPREVWARMPKDIVEWRLGVKLLGIGA